jgi:hypothetical protein
MTKEIIHRKDQSKEFDHVDRKNRNIYYKHRKPKRAYQTESREINYGYGGIKKGLLLIMKTYGDEESDHRLWIDDGDELRGDPTVDDGGRINELFIKEKLRVMRIGKENMPQTWRSHEKSAFRKIEEVSTDLKPQSEPQARARGDEKDR